MASIPDKDKGIPTKTGDKVFVKIIGKKPVASLREAGVMMWIVRTLSNPCGNPKTIEPVELFSRYHICVDVLPDERAAENPEQGDTDRHARS